MMLLDISNYICQVFLSNLILIICLHRVKLVLIGRVVREAWVQSQDESYQRLKKWYLISSCITLSIIRYVWRVKWSNPGKGVVLFPKCSGYWKGSLQVALDYGCQLYFYIYALPWRLSTLAKEFTAAARIMQSSSNESSTLASGKVSNVNKRTLLLLLLHNTL